MFQLKVLTFNAVQENTYLLFNEKKSCIIIDPGFYNDEERQEMEGFIKTNHLVPKWLLNTHCHLDHVFGNKYIGEAYRLTLHIHKDEEPVLQMAPSMGLMFNFPFDNYTGRLIYLKEGDIIKMDDDELEVMEAPGHSPGSICFYCKKQNFIVSGDVLFQNSMGRTDLPGGSHDTLIKSIKEKLFTLPDEVIVYPGHGPATTIGEEKRSNPWVK
ncbi:MAG TPA: MBL fold metallo-hydrolase [Chitinophagaceae bacterium]|nr:MBL fold metallo-hydrolase [Chitinophagaceae bacterium]